MVYVDAEELKWMPYVRSWLAQHATVRKLSPEIQEFLLNLFSKYVENGLRFVQKKCTQAIAQVSSIMG